MQKNCLLKIQANTYNGIRFDFQKIKPFSSISAGVLFVKLSNYNALLSQSYSLTFGEARQACFSVGSAILL